VRLFGPGGTGLALSAATFLSGLFVAGAGLLTYQGGCHAVEAARETGDAGRALGGVVATLLSSTGAVAGWMARKLDPGVGWCIRWLVHPGLFWIPDRVKQGQPFLTSMLARLPWRVITGALALATGTAAGAAFAFANVLWAVGDMAIGSLDLETPEQPLMADDALREWLPAAGDAPHQDGNPARLAFSDAGDEARSGLETLPSVAGREGRLLP
jgi:hypothetical protein